MPNELKWAVNLDDSGVSSPSGGWALRYRPDGCAAITDEAGATTWVAGGGEPAAGSLRLEKHGDLVVYRNDETVWRTGQLAQDIAELHITDNGDALLVDFWGLPRFSLLHGPIEPVCLGDRAPASAITPAQYLQSANGERAVTRQRDGGLRHVESSDAGVLRSTFMPPKVARSLEQIGTELTWLSLPEIGQSGWSLVLADAQGALRWVQGRRRDHAAGHSERTAGSGDYCAAWMDEGLKMQDGYCVTAIRNVEPDEALRRLGARDEEISTATWREFLGQARYAEAGVECCEIAAFAIGSHTLLAEGNGYDAVLRPDLSLGTFAVSSYRSMDGDTVFTVCMNGEVLATVEENQLSKAHGDDPGVLTGPLAAMGTHDLEAFDDDDNASLDDLQLLCRVAGIRPTVPDVAGDARVAIFESSLETLFPLGM